VHGDDGVEVVLGHREQHPVAEDARVVDHHVQLAELRGRQRDQLLCRRPVGDRRMVGDGRAARGGDLDRDRFGRGLVLAVVRALPVQPGAGIVDHHRRAVGGQRQAVRRCRSPRPGRTRSACWPRQAPGRSSSPGWGLLSRWSARSAVCGTHSFSRKARTMCRNCSWESVKMVRRTGFLLRPCSPLRSLPRSGVPGWEIQIDYITVLAVSPDPASLAAWRRGGGSWAALLGAAEEG
jgi:hypothetical protein